MVLLNGEAKGREAKHVVPIVGSGEPELAVILACLVLLFVVVVRRRAFFQEEWSLLSFVM